MDPSAPLVNSYSYQSATHSPYLASLGFRRTLLKESCLQNGCLQVGVRGGTSGSRLSSFIDYPHPCIHILPSPPLRRIPDHFVKFFNYMLNDANFLMEEVHAGGGARGGRLTGPGLRGSG